MVNVKDMEMGDATREYFMPYAMRTIVDRALPDVRDGLKPVQRRILYKMYELGLFNNKQRMKCHPLVGKVMEIHGHGDSSVYEALAKMTTQNESLLHPFIDGEGGFGKKYNTDNPSASRYTFARLSEFSNEMFKGLNKNAVDLIGEDYLQPLVLPVSFPNILIKPNNGISVGFACDFPSFNLEETNNTIIKILNGEEIDLVKDMMIDFPSGGQLIYNENELRKIYDTGKGSVLLRSKYRVDDKYIEVFEIPYNTTANLIIKKINKLIKDGKLKEILDIRDETEFNKETDKDELNITIEIKRGVDPHVLMNKLFRITPLQSTFSANMNCLVDYKPTTLGVRAIIDEWLKFRIKCIERELSFDISKKQKQLHNLKGLEKILLNIDETIKIIRNTEQDNQVIPNLMEYLQIDEIQAQYISDIRLRNLNKEYILKRTNEIENLEQGIKELNDKLNSPESIKQTIIEQLEYVKKQYGQPRKTEIIYADELPSLNNEEIEVENYNTRIFVTEQGYLKKIALTSLRGSSKQQLKEGDSISYELDSSNKSDILVLTDKYNCYKLKSHELDDVKPSQLGVYLPSLLNLKDENITYITSTKDYKGYLLIGFENGKVAKINLSSYEGNRKVLKNAYSDLSKPIYWNTIKEDVDIVAVSSIDKVLVFSSSIINSKSSKTTQGVQIMKSKEGSFVKQYLDIDKVEFEDIEYYRAIRTSIGNYLKKTDKINL
ncbi:DNA gyrase subunit A [Metabacillus fastidiosus]|uniref:DNA gyrase subunit A n=1 Tax=Metabacillus fastidiosus TaxID=1458 RepID=UPI003D2DFD24